MLTTSVSLLVIAIFVAVFGPRGFFLGLGSIIFATLCATAKTLRALFGILDIIEFIFNILSLLG